MNTIKSIKQTPIFFLKPSRGMSSSYVIFFSSTLLKKKKKLWWSQHRIKIEFLLGVGVLSSSFPMNKLCTQEEMRCVSWPRRVFPFPILLLFLTFWFLFNLNYLKNIEPTNYIGLKKN